MIEVEYGGRDATKEELKAWQQVEEKIKEQERTNRQQAFIRTFLAGH